MARKKLLDPIHPGEILREEFLKPLGKRAISADTALRLGKYVGVSSELWLGLQADFDLRAAQRRGIEGDDRIV